MTIRLVPGRLRKKYRFEERHHACAILAKDFPDEWENLLACLDDFRLCKSHMMASGGGRSGIPRWIDGFLQKRGWRKRRFDIQIIVDGQRIPTPTHEIDNFRNRVAVEVEWNSKTESYDRDLNNFRLLHELHVLSVGVIITRVSELRQLFESLGIEKYSSSTTHWDKLIPKVNGGGAGGCPLLLIGITEHCYDPKH